MMVSVALASYNGEKYIEKQISSILINLEPDDELIISDDGSLDGTIDVIKSFNDSRIKIFQGPRAGINKNFENAIYHCSGKYIFLSDQDDVWFDNKVKSVLRVFNESHCRIVEHDALVVDEQENVIYESFLAHRNPHNGVLSNIIRDSFHGCCMAFDSSLKSEILPIPKKEFFHDQWIGIIGEYCGAKTQFFNEQLMKYYRRENNASNFTHDSPKEQIVRRFQLLQCFNEYKKNK